ncbi:hypothetical protein ABW19_dt0206573 [Dactylella cylindrospora]|nr:hypothetical protein ABW19_dt0206573 [Dactylella cylindrospora]
MPESKANKRHQMASSGHVAGPNSSAEKNSLGSGGTKSQTKLGTPLPTLPTTSANIKGGGGLRSVSENFKVNPANGTMSLDIPIYVTPGRSGFTPDLHLSYDSGSGNGPFGIGWQLSSSSIARKTSKTIPTYDDKDLFILSGGEDLVPSLEESQFSKWQGKDFCVKRFKTRVDDASMRVEQWTSITNLDDVVWRTISAENTTTIFGEDDSSRVFDLNSAGNKRTFEWLPSRSYDWHGNEIRYIYKSEDSVGVDELTKSHELSRTALDRGNRKYLKGIKYGNRTPNRDANWVVKDETKDWMFEVVLDYGDHNEACPTPIEDQPWPLRADPFSTYKAGFELRTYRLCRRILMFHRLPEALGRDDFLVSATNFRYKETPTLTQLVECSTAGYRYGGDKSGRFSNLPPLKFEYSEEPLFDDLKLEHLKDSVLLDVPNTYYNSSQWFDLDGEGAPGVLRLDIGPSWSYQRNRTASGDVDSFFGPIKLLSCIPVGDPDSRVSLGDIDGNGAVDAILADVKGNMYGFFEREGDEWSNFNTVQQVSNIDIRNPIYHQIDLTGDGKLDILCFGGAEEQAYWLRNLGKTGYDAPKYLGPGIRQDGFTAEDEKCALYFADMSGDGLTDIVQIANGRISYWPNLGYGKFGRETVMDNSPTFGDASGFDHARIRLLDVYGSGNSDLVYLKAGGGAVVYLNQAGNSWSNPGTVECFPDVDMHSNIFALDLFGKGTPCLCWSGPGAVSGTMGMRFMDLAPSVKPYLLTYFQNGYGKSTSIEYKPSTYFYQIDESKGTPWSTKLPFPVHCVSKVSRVDKISGTESSSTYAYRDGYFDKREREFRGFGQTDRWDDEVFDITGTIRHTQPRKLTRTWHHTGAPGTPSLSFLEPALAVDILPCPPNAKEQLDIFRALKGREIRQEVCSKLENAKETIPFVATSYRYEVIQIQSSSDCQPAVFQTNLKEKMVVSYEQSLEDPKVERNYILEMNGFGDVSKAITIYYGRSCGARDVIKFSEQKETVSVLEITNFTNPIDVVGSYRKPVPCHHKTFQLVNFDISRLDHLNNITYDTLEELGKAEVLSLQSDSVGVRELKGDPKKILVSESEMFYLSSDMGHRLPLGQMQEYSVIDEESKLVYDVGDLEIIYGDRLQKIGREVESLIKDAGYCQLPGSCKWWSPSGRLRFHEDIDNPAEQLRGAQTNFYTPSVTVDPFGNKQVTSLDDFCLRPVRCIDAVGNQSRVSYDYRFLLPDKTIDCNGNQRQIVFDEFGSQIALAVMGKENELVGDSLENISLDVTQDDIEGLIHTPTQALIRRTLGQAGKRWIYDVWRFSRSQEDEQSRFEPSCILELSSDQHYTGEDESRKFLIKIIYLDGSETPIQETELARIDKDGLDSQWRLNRWIINNTNGDPVREFEASFTPSGQFVKPANCKANCTFRFFDPLNRPVVEVLPNHTWGKFKNTPWKRTTYDAGDLINIENLELDEDVGRYLSSLSNQSYLPSWYEIRKDQEPEAAQQSLVYANNPKIEHLDPQGNIIGEERSFESRSLISKFSYDVLGRRLGCVDEVGRTVELSRYDLRGRKVFTSGMDSGQELAIYSTDDQEIFHWNSRDIWKLTKYDTIRRQIETWTAEGNSKPRLEIRIQYGEAVPGDQKRNLRGEITKIYDQTGVEERVAVDYKKNILLSSMQNALNYQSTIDWSEDVGLGGPIFKPLRAYDSFNRLTRESSQLGGCIQYTYDFLGQRNSLLWKKVKEDEWCPFVVGTEYDAEGRELVVRYGNKVVTTKTYDLQTGDLIQRRSVRSDGSCLEDLCYTRDCLGSIVCIYNLVEQDMFFRNQVVDAKQRFSYDALRRLSRAEGREQYDASNGSRKLATFDSTTGRNPGLHRGNGDQVCRYVENYVYDDTGNIRLLKHCPADDTSVSGWTRRYFYTEKSLIEPEELGNRLSYTQVGDTMEMYGYEGQIGATGCMTSMPGYSLLGWNHDDKLQFSSTQTTKEDSVPETTWYTYRYDGQRSRRVTERASSSDRPIRKLKETIYHRGIQIHQVYNGDGATKSLDKTNFVINQEDPICIVEAKKSSDGLWVGSDLNRYQISDALEVDDEGNIVSYEERSPFGVAVYIALAPRIEAPRVYRFAKYETDVETGLCFCSARYYASWLGRWTSPDPLGVEDGLNIYIYVSNDPVNFTDPTGTVKGGTKSKEKKPAGPKIKKDVSLLKGGGAAAAAPTALATLNKRIKEVADQRFKYFGAENWNGIKQVGILTLNKSHLISQGFQEKILTPLGFEGFAHQHCLVMLQRHHQRIFNQKAEKGMYGVDEMWQSLADKLAPKPDSIKALKEELDASAPLREAFLKRVEKQMYTLLQAAGMDIDKVRELKIRYNDEATMEKLYVAEKWVGDDEREFLVKKGVALIP